ncbi:hypothetical protein PanWU01x14_342680 [Parasponia andersonii]|uniref:Uncharacterized protein n=1 Tax=Parasponia andersonii TaxID=3476 RepID=A0A2P5ADR2_PARAD|nr:hypothetical protein PanWU01x14_342680 [Parasponia andersonii]
MCSVALRVPPSVKVRKLARRLVTSDYLPIWQISKKDSYPSLLEPTGENNFKNDPDGHMFYLLGLNRDINKTR